MCWPFRNLGGTSPRLDLLKYLLLTKCETEKTGKKQIECVMKLNRNSEIAN